MARLQKKSTSTAKVKKKELDGGSSGEPGEGTAVKDVVKTIVSGQKQDGKSAEKKFKATATATEGTGPPNWYQKSIQFFREVKVELKKVTWPNRKQTAGSTLVVIILVFILATFLGLVDFGLSKLVQVVLA